MKAFAVVPEALLDASQLDSGISPFKMFKLEGGFTPKDFIEAIDLGNLSPESLTIWNTLKNELREGGRAERGGVGAICP
jgi:hypothetical protein